MGFKGEAYSFSRLGTRGALEIAPDLKNNFYGAEKWVLAFPMLSGPFEYLVHPLSFVDLF